MKKYIRFLGSMAGAVLLVFFYGRALLHQQALRQCEDYALILTESHPLTGEKLQKMKDSEKEQEQPRDFAAWRQENDVQVQNCSLSRTHTVAAVVVCGHSELVLHGTAHLQEEDANGCLIDENTAQKLFGNTDIVGLSIEIDGKEKIIRGILYHVKDTVLYEENSKEQSFTNLTVRKGRNTACDAIRQDFMARHALEGKFVRMDSLGRILGFFCLLVPFLAGCQSLKQCVRAAREHGAKNAGRLTAAASAACAGLFLWLIAGQIRIPAEMIPTKWSDFGFWSEFMARERESLLLLLLTEKQKPLQGFLADFYLGIGAALAAAAAGYLCLHFFGRFCYNAK